MTDLSTNITIMNNTPFEFTLINKDAIFGYWDIPPPGAIPSETSTTTFVLKDTDGAASGSEGNITYAFADVLIDMDFCDSYSLRNNYASGAIRSVHEIAANWYEISVSFSAKTGSGNWSHNSCPKSGHPLYITYAIDSKYPRSLTDAEYDQVKERCPLVNQQIFRFMSEVDDTFNCIAWSLGIYYAWINPEKTVEEMIKLYASAGDVTHTAAKHTPEKKSIKWQANFNYVLTTKLDEYADVDLMCTLSKDTWTPAHATRRYQDAYFKFPTWTSKLGEAHIVRHERKNLAGPWYGEITHSFVKKAVKGQNENVISQDLDNVISQDPDNVISQDPDNNIILKDFHKVYQARHSAIMDAPFDVIQMRKLNDVIEKCDAAFKICFEERYACWKRECANMRANSTYDYVFLHSFRNLAIMGSGILPLVVKKMSLEHNFHTLPLYESLQPEKMLCVSQPSAYTHAEDALPLESEQSRARRTVHRYLQYLP